MQTTAGMLNAVWVNVRANGGEVLEAALADDTCVSARVTYLLNEDLMSHFNTSIEVASKFWNKFIPIATALGLRFEWNRLSGRALPRPGAAVNHHTTDRSSDCTTLDIYHRLHSGGST